MEGETVMYDGRVVPKEGFRVFIYGFDNQTKLVESWEEYKNHISSGVWFTHKNFDRQDKSLESNKQEYIEKRQQKKRERE